MHISAKIKDVAEKAGVSVTTVSRVLNEGKYVREELKEKVQKAIEELEYAPNYIARSLVRKKTNLIGVIVPDITSSFFSTILSSIEEVATQNGYNILVSNISENFDKELKYLNVFKEMRVEGIILMHGKLNKQIHKFLKSIDIPVILSSVKFDDLKFPSVNIDDFRASYDAVQYLIDLGHRRIAVIGGDNSAKISGFSRYSGFLKAMKDNNMPLIDELVKFGNLKMRDGYRLMDELLKCNPLPTAVFAFSDDMAVGALNCIIDNGLKVPQDISVVGFDDSDLAVSVRPKLTTMHQPIKEIGSMSVEILLKQMSGQALYLNEIVLNHKIVERESCKRL